MSLWVLREQGQSPVHIPTERAAIPKLMRERRLSWYLPRSPRPRATPSPQALGPLAGTSLPASRNGAGAASQRLPEPPVPPCGRLSGDLLLFLLGGLGRLVHCWVLAIHGAELPSATHAGQERGTCDVGRRMAAGGFGEGPGDPTGPARRGPSQPSAPAPSFFRQTGFLGRGRAPRCLPHSLVGGISLAWTCGSVPATPTATKTQITPTLGPLGLADPTLPGGARPLQPRLADPGLCSG